MRHRSLLALFVVVALCLFSSSALAAKKAKPVSEDDLLQGVGTTEKEKAKTAEPPKASMSLLLRDDLKAAFKDVMRAYFQEDEEKFLGNFADNITLGSRARAKKPFTVGKDELRARVKKEFAASDFKAVTVDEVFDFASPTMVFCLAEEQMHDKVPVWGFTQEPSEILKFMKPGDYLVIANTRPQAADKVSSIPFTYYLIFRKVGEKFVAVGLD